MYIYQYVYVCIEKYIESGCVVSQSYISNLGEKDIKFWGEGSERELM